MGSKKLSGSAKGYLILLSLVVVSWVIFKILTPHNFGSPANMLNYFQASLIATVGAVGSISSWLWECSTSPLVPTSCFLQSWDACLPPGLTWGTSD